MSNADALSRLPLPEVPSDSSSDVGEIDLVLNHLSEAIVTAAQIKSWTEKDPQVHHLILHGWTATNLNKDLQPYFNNRDELSVVNGCVLWGSRVVIPPQGRSIVLDQSRHSSRH